MRSRSQSGVSGAPTEGCRCHLPRGNHLTVLSIDGTRARARLWDGALVSAETNDIARSEVRRVYHLRATVEMPDEWLVVSPDGGGSTWTCFWVPFDDAYEMLHEYQRDWLDAARPALDKSAVEDHAPRARAPLPPDFVGAELMVQFHAPPFGGRLVVLDLLLPRMDGLTVLRQLAKERPELPRLLRRKALHGGICTVEALPRGVRFSLWLPGFEPAVAQTATAASTAVRSVLT